MKWAWKLFIVAREPALPAEGHKVYPYPLRGLSITRPNQVWRADITYIPVPGGHVYLCAVMAWFSRKALGWALSNSMDVALCLAALEMAIAMAGTVPGIFNTDQGAQCTSLLWIETLEAYGIAISMDGRGRWLDNVFIERLWRTLKYDEIYRKEYATLLALGLGLADWFVEYNDIRPHQALGQRTPSEVHTQAA